MESTKEKKQNQSEKYRQFLKDELHRILERNNHYSLRSFAKKLKVNPGVLSALLNGQRPITQKQFLKIAQEMSLSPEELERLEKPSQEPSVTLEQHMFEYLSHWYYDAFLELAQTSSFKNDDRWIAHRLKVSTPKVQEIKYKLSELGFVKEDGETLEVNLKDSAVFAEKSTSSALKKLQSQASDLSKSALEHDPIEARYHATNTFAFDPEKMDEAKEALREFRKKFCKTMKKGESRTGVYQLNLSFYRIDQI